MLKSTKFKSSTPYRVQVIQKTPGHWDYYISKRGGAPVSIGRVKGTREDAFTEARERIKTFK